LRTIYIRQKLSIPPDFYAPDIRCFRIQRRTADRSIPPVRITGAFPPENWSQDNYELRIPATDNTFLGVLFARGQSSSYGHSAKFQIIVGLDRGSKHYWCKAVEHAWPEMTVDRGRWRATIRRLLPPSIFDPMMKNDARHDIFVVADSELGVNVSIRAGLCGDSVALQVLIDGLIRGR
jgi:hypothetical protein